MQLLLQSRLHEAERAVLGTLLKNGRFCAAKDPALRVLAFPGAWSSPAHSAIMDAIVRYCRDRRNGARVSVKAVARLLAADGTLHTAGGTAYLESLTACACDDSRAMEALLLVLDAAARRQLLEMADRVQADAVNPDRPALSVALNAHRQVRNVAERLLRPDIRRPRPALHDSIGTLEHAVMRDGGVFYTGYPLLDAELLGLRPGDLCVFAAAPQVDMTAFLAGILDRSILPPHAGTKTLAVTLRNSLAEWLLAVIQGRTQFSVSYLMDTVHSNNTAPWDKILDTCDVLYHVGDQNRFAACRLNSPSIEAIRVAVGMARKESGIELLIIDGQETLLSGREEDPAAVVRELQHLAKEYRIPIIVLATLRKVPLDKPVEPALPLLDELGPLASMADTLALLWMTPCCAPVRWGDESRDLNVFIARHWYRAGGQVRLHYRSDLRSYADSCWESDAGNCDARR